MGAAPPAPAAPSTAPAASTPPRPDVATLLAPPRLIPAKHVQLESGIYDLAGFAHPGGDFLHHLYGKDATHALHTAHADPSQVLRRLARRRVAAAAAPSAWLAQAAALAPLARHANPLPLLAPVAALLLWWAAAGWGWGAFALLCLAQAQVIHEQHNLVHHCVMELGLGRSWDRFVLQWFCVAWNGLYAYGGFSHAHAKHHVFTNVAGLDESRDLPFEYDPRQPRSAARAGLWFSALGLLAGPYFVLYSFSSHYAADGLDSRLRATLARWVVLYFLSPTLLLRLTAAQFLASAVLIYVATLNHQDLPHADTVGESPLAHQFDMTRSYFEGNAAVRYVLGGFDHHTRHHLFPRVPWHRLHEPALAPYDAETEQRNGFPTRAEVVKINFNAVLGSEAGADKAA